MEKKTQPTLITTSETALRANLLATGLRLTPTGKISHAKTRVYTQRYRKEWEQMPDFKGWLTSVPFQPTRAYCTYCKKNLHAHRLSLLKHTCTMKHQRAALMHEAEEKKKRLKSDSEVDVEIEEGNDDDLEGIENAQGEMEENEDESEYVVERLDMYDEEMEEPQLKTDNVVDEEEEEEEEEEDEENDVNLSMASDEEDVKPIIKKLKVESMKGCRDTLAEAMAHVHSEYLEEPDDQGNVQIEMVVESEEQSNPEMQVMTVLPDSEDGDKEDELKESDENERSSRRADARKEKMSGEDCKPPADQDIMVACSLPILGTAYQISPSVAQSSNTIGVLQSVNTIPISGSQSKTITFTSGGKTLTLTGGTFQPGAQYVLNKVKGKIPTLVMATKKSSGNQEDVKPVQSSKIAQEQSAVAGTSQQFSKKHLLLNPLKFDKKPRISTHVMDTTKGLPVGGLQVSLYKLMDGRWTFLNESNTSPNGRCANLVENMKINFTAGRYKIHFDVDKYFTLRRIETMYPFIEIVFDVKNPASHYHIPVLLSPFGYTTYRGSER